MRVLAEERFAALEILCRPLEKGFAVINELNGRPERKLIALGMGTIKTESMAIEAVKLRPDFMVSPAFSRKVLRVAVQAGIPYIPAVRTFQDVQDVLEAFEEENVELKILKLCPVEGLTVKYVNMLGGCYPGIVFCPTGEVTEENYAYWRSSKFIGPGMGSNFVPEELIVNGEWDRVRECLRKFEERKDGKE